MKFKIYISINIKQYTVNSDSIIHVWLSAELMVYNPKNIIYILCIFCMTCLSKSDNNSN